MRRSESLVVPPDAGYDPPQPTMPGYISLSAKDMAMLCAFMRAAGAVDPKIVASKQRRDCAQGQVPIYKFLLNNGYVVTAPEAALIADALSRTDVFAPEFLRVHFPKVNPERDDLLTRPRALVRLWTGDNRVAAANDGYTVR